MTCSPFATTMSKVALLVLSFVLIFAVILSTGYVDNVGEEGGKILDADLAIQNGTFVSCGVIGTWSGYYCARRIMDLCKISKLNQESSTNDGSFKKGKRELKEYCVFLMCIVFLCVLMISINIAIPAHADGAAAGLQHKDVSATLLALNLTTITYFVFWIFTVHAYGISTSETDDSNDNKPLKSCGKWIAGRQSSPKWRKLVKRVEEAKNHENDAQSMKRTKIVTFNEARNKVHEIPAREKRTISNLLDSAAIEDEVRDSYTYSALRETKREFQEMQDRHERERVEREREWLKSKREGETFDEEIKNIRETIPRECGLDMNNIFGDDSSSDQSESSVSSGTTNSSTHSDETTDSDDVCSNSTDSNISKAGSTRPRVRRQTDASTDTSSDSTVVSSGENSA